MASLPRPQTVLIFLICSITVGMVALSVYGWPNFGKFSYSNNTIAQIPAPITATASDFGGQNDWQKQFFENDKTGAYKATEKTTAKPAAKNLPLTATDLLGRNFFTKYVELRQSGLSSDAKAVNNAAAAVISESLAGIAGIAEPKVYSLKDLKVVADNIETTKAYAENLMKILKDWMPAKNEVEITMNAFEKNDMTLLKNIDMVTNGYKSVSAKLLALPVNQTLAGDHLDLINGINLQIFNARALRRADVDPVTALAAINLEIKSLEAISKAVGNMQNYFTKAGIVFVPPVSSTILQTQ